MAPVLLPTLLPSEDGITEKLNTEQVSEDYEKYTGAKPSKLTHSEKLWQQTERNEIITEKIIKDFYSSLAANAYRGFAYNTVNGLRDESISAIFILDLSVITGNVYAMHGSEYALDAVRGVLPFSSAVFFMAFNASGVISSMVRSPKVQS
ncbi:MAG: hypothetical protein LBO73_04810 [Holosporaceae bacterium]|nr:hypothetical protein [Holosporaceae bacterium]